MQVTLVNRGADPVIIDLLGDIKDEVYKIDLAAADGLAGVPGSVAYMTAEVEEHLHSQEWWFGISTDQSGDNWAADRLVPFQAISGNGDYGGDANDEAKVIGADDTPVGAGMTLFDMHRILIDAVSQGTVYKLRVVWGDGTMSEAILAGQYSESQFLFDSVNPQLSAGIPVDIRLPRLDVGTKVWVQCKNATDNATIDFYVGLHEYEG